MFGTIVLEQLARCDETFEPFDKSTVIGNVVAITMEITVTRTSTGQMR
jgi:hypothetical protein